MICHCPAAYARSVEAPPSPVTCPSPPWPLHRLCCSTALWTPAFSLRGEAKSTVTYAILPAEETEMKQSPPTAVRGGVAVPHLYECQLRWLGGVPWCTQKEWWMIAHPVSSFKLERCQPIHWPSDALCKWQKECRLRRQSAFQHYLCLDVYSATSQHSGSCPSTFATDFAPAIRSIN